MPTRTPGLAVLIAGALLASACGSSRLDSGELHDKVAGACTKAHKALLAVPDPKSADQVQNFLNGSSAAMTTLVAELRGLKPPSDVEQTYSMAVSLVAEQAASLAKASRQLQQGGDPIVVVRNIADQTSQNSQREKAAWDALGIEECANR